MKTLSLTALLTLALLSTNSFAHEGEFDGSFDGDLVTDTKDLRIYDDVQTLMNKDKGGLKIKNFGQVEPFLGLPMKYPTMPHPMADRNIGLATFHNGMRVVLFGPNVAMQLGANIMGYFIQHEYAHHDLNHNANMSVNSATREGQADCQAAKELKRYGRTDVIGQVIQWYSAQGCHYDPNINTMYVQDSHPCGIQRARILQQCAQ